MAQPPNIGPTPPTPPPPPPKLPPKLPAPVEHGGHLADKFLEFMGGTARQGKVLPGVGKIAVTYLAPQPFGFVPPRYYGLPENYLLGFTPHEVVDRVTAPHLLELADERRFELDRERLSSRLDEVDKLGQLDKLTRTELVRARQMIRDVALPGDEVNDVTRAIDRQLQRRFPTEHLRPFNALSEVRKDIEDKVAFERDFPGLEPGTREPPTDAIEWPGNAGGFIDALARFLRPDP